MQIQVQGQGTVTLTEQDFAGEGGEGRIYARGDWVYKLYFDPARMIPVAKIRELAVLDRPNIIRPENVLLDTGGCPIGFRMRRVERAVPLARLFNSEFRTRYGIGPDSTLRLVEALRMAIQFVHDRGCLIVDGNEMNYLVAETGFTEPYLIDVDSYQTPGFPATAILDAIRDWHSPDFTTLSDWFSFAVVVCQLFIGIHPYRGRHPDFGKNDLEGRMKANVSIFHRGVILPPAVRNFGLIPATYRDWFITLFEQGVREPPPPLAGPMPAVMPAPIVASMDHLAMTLLECFPETIVRVQTTAGHRLIFNRHALHLDSEVFALPGPEADVVFTPRTGTPLLLWQEDSQLRIRHLRTGALLPGTFRTERFMVVDNTIYVLHQGAFMALRLHELGGRCLVAPGPVWNVLPQATVMLQNLLCQNVLGKAHLLIPFESERCQVIAVPELDGCRIVDGRWDGGIAVIIAYRQGHFDRFTFRFNVSHTRYRVRIESNVDTPAINFIALDSGGVVALHGEALEFFSRQPEQETIKVIREAVLAKTALTLAKEGGRILGFVGERIYGLEPIVRPEKINPYAGIN
jgi:hypothetical protein